MTWAQIPFSRLILKTSSPTLSPTSQMNLPRVPQISSEHPQLHMLTHVFPYTLNAPVLYFPVWVQMLPLPGSPPGLPSSEPPFSRVLSWSLSQGPNDKCFVPLVRLCAPF